MHEISSALLAEIRSGKEKSTIEFKDAQGKDGEGAIPKSAYETVCSFSNHYGGNLYLGVQDDGTILGIMPDKIQQLKKDFVTAIQSSNKIDPPLYLDIDEYTVDSKSILHVYIPNSSQVHRLNQRIIYDRNEDADIDVTNNTTLVQRMYTRKQSEYTENTLYKHVDISEFRTDLIDRVRQSMTDSNGERLLIGKSDLDVLKSLSMYRKDYLTGNIGCTLAGILTFGKDELIRAIVPYFTIDVLVRIKDIDRYDDRLRIKTNLIDSYTQLMSFIAKHINEPFYLDGDKRINLREVLFREVIVNLLVHREYSNPYISRIEIRSNIVTFENANKPVHPGIIKLGDIRPYPKNPNIASVFHILGLIDEIGSGMEKIFNYGTILFGGLPIIENEEEFKVKIPVTTDGLSNLVSHKSNRNELSSLQREVLVALSKGPLPTKELLKLSDIKNGNTFRTHVITPLLDKGLIELTIPDKPRSPKQKYRLSVK
ncbi:RNA-binding domain-containing protein [Loigolactobacillus binensis]|uniref:RNA-binding domain-containing protein n=1 Tax=Loigolactobacillus binensis TaxID=2559922 RepID=A0ABW3EBK3_9LACO|nr:RNA-binding domain-containing protein [Loigolactobacillus binensis]